ncbi:hypothetical protein ILYODFUR_037062 [Ilyodon furcidens]|uniref:Aquaporin n=1 Tax=Ilyodon furcidens TaxID=33524 RepID=A0ABV0T3A7_9TELE
MLGSGSGSGHGETQLIHNFFQVFVDGLVELCHFVQFCSDWTPSVHIGAGLDIDVQTAPLIFWMLSVAHIHGGLCAVFFLQLGRFPEKMKIAEVIPIYKAGNKLF